MILSFKQDKGNICECFHIGKASESFLENISVKYFTEYESPSHSPFENSLS